MKKATHSDKLSESLILDSYGRINIERLLL